MILDELRREHRNIEAVLGVLDRQVVKFEAGGKPDYELIASIVDYFLGATDRYHHAKEDMVFARLCERDAGAARAIGDLPVAHQELAVHLGTFAAGLRSVVGEAEVPREAFVHWARDFIELQRRHRAMEETDFFPAAERALTAQDWRELAAAMTRAPDPLLGGAGDLRFDTLLRNILEWEAEA